MVDVVVIGGGGVGKSSLTIQYVQNFFVSYYDPTIEDSYRKQVEVDDKVCLMQILDTAGQEEFNVMRDGWMRNGDCFLLVFSATSRNSFEEMQACHKHLLRVKDAEAADVPVVMVMNKMDTPKCEQEVSVDEAEETARAFGCPLIQTSAKTALNVTDCFHEAVRQYRKVCLQSTETKLTNTRRPLFSMCSIM